MNQNYNPSILESAIGVIGLASWITFCFCLATLKRHIDSEKISKEALAKLAKGEFPSKAQLTTVGVFRYNLAIITLLVGIILCGGIVIRNALK